MRFLYLALATGVFTGSAGFVAAQEPVEDRAPVKVILPSVKRADVVVDPASGGYVFDVEYKGGELDRLSADEFAAMMYRSQAGRPFWQALLNISSPIGVAWVGLGFLGQILFTGRMLVQWIVSEKAQRSVIPVAFWWMSVGGATMLLVYFVWRKDIVGVIGQSTGWFIYCRNLWFIYRRGTPALT